MATKTTSTVTTTGTNLAVNAQKAQACEQQRLVGFGIGGLGVGGLITYGLHTWMVKNAPSYNTMGQGSKYAGAAAIIGISGYAMGRYMENRCRKDQGLPPL